MRIADIKKQNLELKKQNAELKKELELANDQLKAFESLISRKENKIGELIKQNSELSAIILSFIPLLFVKAPSSVTEPQLSQTIHTKSTCSARIFSKVR